MSSKKDTFMRHRSDLTDGFEPIITNTIWKVRDLTESDRKAVYPALCDWANVDMKEINKTKDIVTRVIFGRPIQGYKGCRLGNDFIKLSLGREYIFIQSAVPTHEKVGIYYGIMPEELRMQCAAGSVDFEMFCMILSCTSPGACRMEVEDDW